PDEIDRVEAAGGRVINWNGYRVLGVLATSRSIGDQYFKPYVISVPKVSITKRTEKDEFVILARDGLYDVMSNEMACQVVRHCRNGQIGRTFANSTKIRQRSLIPKGMIYNVGGLKQVKFGLGLSVSGSGFEKPPRYSKKGECTLRAKGLDVIQQAAVTEQGKTATPSYDSIKMFVLDEVMKFSQSSNKNFNLSPLYNILHLFSHDRPDEIDRVEAAGGRVINWNGYRVLGVLATSRSIGDQYFKPYVISVPKVSITKRTEKDEFVILARDGLYDVMSNEMACRVVRHCRNGQIGRTFANSTKVVVL
ncbi:hypothetical protein IFM89_028324, partial [Coptis chinensis]